MHLAYELVKHVSLIVTEILQTCYCSRRLLIMTNAAPVHRMLCSDLISCQLSAVQVGMEKEVLHGQVGVK